MHDKNLDISIEMFEMEMNGKRVEVRLGGGPWIDWDKAPDVLHQAYGHLVSDALKKGVGIAYPTPDGKGSITVRIYDNP